MNTLGVETLTLEEEIAMDTRTQGRGLGRLWEGLWAVLSYPVPLSDALGGLHRECHQFLK